MDDVISSRPSKHALTDRSDNLAGIDNRLMVGCRSRCRNPPG
jgi:hypothetical protein